MPQNDRSNFTDETSPQARAKLIREALRGSLRREDLIQLLNEAWERISDEDRAAFILNILKLSDESE